MNHPTDEEIRQYVEGEPPLENAEALAAHFVDCAECRRKRDLALASFGTLLSGVEMTANPKGPQAEAAPPPNLDGPLATGTAVGRYTILDRIGSGGMGVVYSAYDPKLDRRVALKFFTTDTKRRHPSLQTRFMREAQAMAHLSHPNVVAVHDVGTIGEDVFIAMELVNGRDLRAWLKEKNHTWREVVEVMVAAGRGLAAAHTVGLVHRDIKPSNILVGNDGRARVMDFGLARNVEGREDSDSDERGKGTSALDKTLTAKGAVMGTPQYMAPEQRVGSPVDARADQFAFAATLYRALFDKIPFGKLEQHEMSLGHLVKPAEPPATKLVPPRVTRVVMRGLAMRPDDRYPSMDAMLGALTTGGFRISRRNILIGAGLALVLVGASIYPAQRLQRAQQCSGAADALSGVWDDARRSAAAAAFRATQKPYAEEAWRRAESALDAYARSWSEAKKAACEATAVRRDVSAAVGARREACLDRRLKDLASVSTVLARADEHVVDGAAGAIEGLSPVASCMSADRPSHPAPPVPQDPKELEEARARLAQADLLLQTARLDDARKLVNEATPPVHRAGDATAIAQATRLAGQLDFEAGKLEQARQELEDAEWLAEAVPDAELSAQIAEALVTLAYRQSQLDLAHLWAQHARAQVRAAGGDEGLEADVDVREAVIFRAEAKMERAQELAQRAYVLRLRRFGPDSARVAQALMQLSSVAAAQGDDRQALEHVSQAAALFERSEGPAHPDTAAARGLEGAYLVDLGRCTDAQGLLDAALQARQAANPHHPYLGLNHWDLGNLYRKLGDEPKAQSHFDLARALLRESFGDGHRYVGSLLADLGRLRVQQGHPEEALPLQDAALAILSKSPTRDYGGALMPQAVRGLALGAQGQWARARDAYAEALAAGQKLLGARDPRLAEPLTGQAEAALALARPQEALPLLRAALELRKDHPGDPADDARARFALAQALWQTGSKAEAKVAAEEARSQAARACNGQLAGVPRIEAWIAAH